MAVVIKFYSHTQIRGKVELRDFQDLPKQENADLRVFEERVRDSRCGSNLHFDPFRVFPRHLAPLSACTGPNARLLRNWLADEMERNGGSVVFTSSESLFQLPKILSSWSEYTKKNAGTSSSRFDLVEEYLRIVNEAPDGGMASARMAQRNTRYSRNVKGESQASLAPLVDSGFFRLNGAKLEFTGLTVPSDFFPEWDGDFKSWPNLPIASSLCVATMHVALLAKFDPETGSTAAREWAEKVASVPCTLKRPLLLEEDTVTSNDRKWGIGNLGTGANLLGRLLTAEIFAPLCEKRGLDPVYVAWMRNQRVV